MAARHAQASPTHLLFPRWQAGSATVLTPISKGSAFERLASHSFNYSLLGRLGFELTSNLIDACQCADFVYSDLADGLATLDALT